MDFRKTLFSGLFALAGCVLPAVSYASDSAEEKPVYRDNVAFSVNKADLSVNDKPYESGASLNVYGDIDIPISDKISLNPKLHGSYFSYGVLEDNASEEVWTVDASLEGRVALGSGVYLGVGGEYFLDDELMLYKDTRGFIKRRSIGPVITFGINSQNCDFSVSLSELFGHKRTSFDAERLIRTEHLNIAVTPRSKRIEIRAMLDFFHSVIADIPADRHNLFLNFTVQIGIDVSPHLSLFPHISYIYNLFGGDMYRVGEAGLGARIKW